MSHFREPVIGDDFDLQTYGRPQVSSAASAMPRSRAQTSDRAQAWTDAPSAAGREGGVRTVHIKGQATPPRRRPQRSASLQIDRYARRPDRTAQWALFLGVFMVVVAVVTGS